MALNKPLRVLELGDIHLGHPNTPTIHIIRNLHTYIINPGTLSSVDLLVLAGDVFDNLLDLPMECVTPIQAWAFSVVAMCAEKKVAVLVLEGTPSHDRKQSVIFLQQNERLFEMTGQRAELYYVQDLSVQRIESLDIDVLCVPDEWGHDAQDTQAQVDALLKAKGMTQVDLAVMHGHFAYQVPQIASSKHKFDEQFFLDRVRYLIFIGHIHQASQYDRIFAAGSTDRLSHGDENDKGALLATIHPSGRYTVKTLANPGAMVYHTVVAYDMDLDEALLRIAHQISGFDRLSNINVETRRECPVFQAGDVLRKRWPHFKWKITDKTVKDVREVIRQEQKQYVPLIINPNTITPLVENALRHRGVSANTFELAMVKLREVL